MSEPDTTAVDDIVARHGRRRESLIPMLQEIQERWSYLPPEALRRLCAASGIHPADVEAVATFYMQFRHRPSGRHMISVCHGTACHVKGAPLVYEAFRRGLALAPGEDTDAAGVFTLQQVACLGCCTLAPAAQIDGITYGHLSPAKVPGVLADFLNISRADSEAAGLSRRHKAAAGTIQLGMGSCCAARGAGKVRDALAAAAQAAGVGVNIKTVGCVGMCHQTPLVEVHQPQRPPVIYSRVQPEDAADIVRRHFRPPGAVRRAGGAVSAALQKLLTDEAWSPLDRYALNVRDGQVQAFLAPQVHIATEHCGRLDPLDLDEYIVAGGYEALRRCVLELSPEEIIARVAASGLAGRGGAGYPTGLKWSHVRAAAGDAGKYIICNGDEGDPGAFMDRMLLESYPHRVIEGMLIAARAVGAAQGVLYIRAEYPLAVQRIESALKQAAGRGLTGERIFGSDFSISLRIMQGAGAFVCGEETALIASIEGRRGMPRLRPPYPAQQGLWGRPTLVNNVETYACVPWIIRNGHDAFAGIGTAASRGTKVFALAGKVSRGGLVEVPMGATLRQMVEQIGGGVAGGGEFKAVQVGGPSGGCVPAAMADTPVDYQALAAAGAIMGSGGMIVLDDRDCMVEMARYFLEFTQGQSCGRCTFCRVGTRRMLEILEALCTGNARAGDLEGLRRLAEGVQAGSLCGLGRTAPNPVLSTLRHYADEYQAHLHGRCPAGKCKALIRYEITDDCIGCTLCWQNCPADAIVAQPYQKHAIDPARCIRCDGCRQVCPSRAVRVV